MPNEPTASQPIMTFANMLRLDAIRKENHCGRAICAYETDCECWRELMQELGGLPNAE